MSTTLTETKNNGMQQIPASGEATVYCPRFDIWETEDEMILYGDMPGVLPENLDIQYEGDQLTIHGKVCPRHDDIKFSYGEYGIGDYHRSFTVTEVVDADKISAELKHGVLTLHLPKSEKVRPRRIEVKSD